MDIGIKASNVKIEIASGKIELENVNVADLIKNIISEIDIDDFMDAVKESIFDSELSELAVWLDHNYNLNALIKKLDEPKRIEEILEQLIIDRD